MDSVDPGNYLATLMTPQAPAGKALAQASAPAAPSTDSATLDRQILALATASSASANTQGTQDPNAQAAQSAEQTAAGKQQYLRFGPWTTPVPTPHWLDNGISGAGGRAMQLGQWAGQSVGIQPDPLKAAVAQQLQSTTGGKVGSFLMDTGLTAPLGGAATSGLARLGGVGARIAGNTFGRAAVQGAVQGAATAPPGSRLEGAGLGAVLSPALPLAGAAGGKVVQGLTRTPEAQALLDRGVQLTPGQMNPTGKIVNRAEQAFTNLPIVGGTIANARAAAQPQYARAMVQDAMAPGAKLTTTSGDFNDLIAEGQQGFDQAYNSTLRSSVPGGGFPVTPKILNTSGPDTPLSKALSQLAATPRAGLTQAQRQGLGQQLQDQLNETIAVAKRSGGLQADDLQQLRSAFRDAARDVSPIDNASRAQRGFWSDAQQTVTQALESQLPSKTSQALRDIDQQYSKFAIVRDVAKAAKDQPGGPTPAQFTNAIAQATPASTYAAGGGWNRDLSKSARSVFQSTVPQTGATGAGIIGPVMHGLEGAGALALGMHNPLALAGIGAGLGTIGGAYTRPGLRALAGQTGWQQAAQRQLARLTPAQQAAISRYARAGLLSGPLNQALQPAGGLMGQ